MSKSVCSYSGVMPAGEANAMVPTSAMPAPQRRAFAIRMGVSMRRAASLGSCRSARLPGTRRFRGPVPDRLSRVPLMVAFGGIGRCLLFGAPMRPWPSGAALRCRWRGLPPRIAGCRRSVRAPASRARPSLMSPMSVLGRQEASRAERLGGVEAPDGAVPSEGRLPARSSPALRAP